MLPFLDILTPIINKVLDFIPDPQKKAEAQLNYQKELDANSQAIMASLTAVDAKQADINIEEAKSTNWFIAGSRPFLMWVCAAAFAWAFVLEPIATFTLAAAGRPFVLPKLDMSEMMPVLMGMLGLSGLRSYEKTQGVQNNH